MGNKCCFDRQVLFKYESYANPNFDDDDEEQIDKRNIEVESDQEQERELRFLTDEAEKPVPAPTKLCDLANFFSVGIYLTEKTGDMIRVAQKKGIDAATSYETAAKNLHYNLKELYPELRIRWKKEPNEDEPPWESTQIKETVNPVDLTDEIKDFLKTDYFIKK